MQDGIKTFVIQILHMIQILNIISIPLCHQGQIYEMKKQLTNDIILYNKTN